MATQPPLPDAGVPRNDADHIGSASMQPDGTLRMQLRAVADDGTIGEMLMIVKPGEEGYDGYVQHLGGIQPGQHKSIPPFGAA
ncbi:MAG: hypothetical protein ACKVQR_01110 [Aquabacterium sp.]